MSYEAIVGLQVTDNGLYTRYRKAMKPILAEYGGGFRYDFKVSEVLKNEDGNPMNRVFAICFSDKQAMDSFFANVEYKKVKQQFFEKSVSATTIISQYNR